MTFGLRKKHGLGMINLLKKRIYPIGVDLGSGFLRMAQIAANGKGPLLHKAASIEVPPEIKAGSPQWQKWAAQETKKMVRRSGFKGKAIVTALPADDIFIDQIKIPPTSEKKIDDAVFAKIAPKLPFPSEGAAIKHVLLSQNPGTSEMDILVMATERTKLDRHLAIYETAGLEIKSICVWPQAMINSFTAFFCRREEDSNKVAMLIDIGSNHSNVVICRQSDLHFARVIPLGFNQLQEGNMIQRLTSEIDACCRYYNSQTGSKKIQRLIFLAGKEMDAKICEKVADIAQKMQIPAQMGDVMSAIQKKSGSEENIDRRNNRINWASAFGLSMVDAAL
jgi:Tfp pilus assembly PilM family ATPase